MSAPEREERGLLHPASAHLKCAPALAMIRVIGLLLLMLTALPFYRLLNPERTGLAGSYTEFSLDIYTEFMWLGGLLLVPAAILGARLISAERLTRWGGWTESIMLRLPGTTYGALWGVVGALFTAAFSLGVLEGRPSNIDALAQLLQARFWSEGMLTGPAHDFGGFWGIQNALFTDRGWVSQYPPGHVAVLTPFLLIGLPWLVGPVLVLVTIFFTSLLAEEMFEKDPLVARLATVLLAFSPFFIFIAGSFMNHITTAAATSFGAWALVRAWRHRYAWAVAAGGAFGLSLATRPLSTIVFGGVFLIGIPQLWPATHRRLLKVVGLSTLGASPSVGAWLAYNQYFFGSPLRMGYNVTLGEAMSLGWHRDPWGNEYGISEAIAYTSSDLITLGVNLFETPLSAVLVIAAYLVIARRLPRREVVVLMWAAAPVAANTLYWHHGIYMGPRMLHEATPAWVLLFAVATMGMLRSIPEYSAFRGVYRARSGLAVALVAAFMIGLVGLTPRRALSYGGTWIDVFRTPLPEVDGPALVFTHDAWNARIAMTLASTGMRLDRIETLLRQNSTCAVYEYTRAVFSGDNSKASVLYAGLDTLPRANRFPPPVRIAPGSDVRLGPGEVLSGVCAEEALSDRFGIIDIAPLLWQVGLHGTEPGGALVVRDMGPERNDALLQRYPDRMPWVFAMSAPDGQPQIYPYAEGMARLWGAPSDLSAGHLLFPPE